MATVLRRIRILTGKTQEQFADILDVSRSYYSLIECGRLIPSCNVSRKIESALGISIKELLTRVDCKDLGLWRSKIN